MAAVRKRPVSAKEFNNSLLESQGLTRISASGGYSTGEGGKRAKAADDYDLRGYDRDDDDEHGTVAVDEEVDVINYDELLAAGPAGAVEEKKPQSLADLADGPNREAANQIRTERTFTMATVCNFIAIRLVSSSGGKHPSLFSTQTNEL